MVSQKWKIEQMQLNFMHPYTESNFFNAKKRKGNKKSMKAFSTDFSTKRHEHRH